MRATRILISLISNADPRALATLHLNLFMVFDENGNLSTASYFRPISRHTGRFLWIFEISLRTTPVSLSRPRL